LGHGKILLSLIISVWPPGRGGEGASVRESHHPRPKHLGRQVWGFDSDLSLLLSLLDLFWDHKRLYICVCTQFIPYTVDSPQMGHPPCPGKAVAFRICLISGPHAIGGTAFIAAKTRHFEDLFDLRVSDMRTVNCRGNLEANLWNLIDAVDFFCHVWFYILVSYRRIPPMDLVVACPVCNQ
jgi:hypothetical protein